MARGDPIEFLMRLPNGTLVRVGNEVSLSDATQTSIDDMEADVTAILALATLIDGYTEKIDDLATDGLAGVHNSAAYRIHEIERHFHGRERWWGAVAVPDETNAIEANVTRPYVAISGNDDWGAAIPVIGTADQPAVAGSVYFDIHRVLISDLDDDTTPWRFRFIWGAGTSGAAITAGDWSEIMVQSNAVPGNRAGGEPADKVMVRVAVGQKVWAQAWNDTNAEELSFFIGAHGYPG